MNIRILAGAAFGAMIAVSGASAADLPVRAPAPAPIIVAPYFSWQGFYIGGNVGYGMVDGDVVGIRTVPANAFVGRFGNARSDGFFGGLQAGYNLQFNSFVAGVEIDAQLSGMSATTTVAPLTTKTDINWFGTLRGRLGYLVTPNLLLYGTGGVALTDISYNISAPVALSSTNQRVGWTAGAGAEYALNNNWSVKGEALYVSTGKNRIVNAAATFSTLETQSFWAFRLGLNYRFGGPAGPVIAKY